MLIAEQGCCPFRRAAGKVGARALFTTCERLETMGHGDLTGAAALVDDLPQQVAQALRGVDAMAVSSS